MCASSLAQVAPSGECLQGEGRPGAIVCSRLAPLVFGRLFARAKPCCWFYLACMPVLVSVVLSCVSAVVIMYFVAVCLRFHKVDYYYYSFSCSFVHSSVHSFLHSLIHSFFPSFLLHSFSY